MRTSWSYFLFFFLYYINGVAGREGPGSMWCICCQSWISSISLRTTSAKTGIGQTVVLRGVNLATTPLQAGLVVTVTAHSLWLVCTTQLQVELSGRFIVVGRMAGWLQTSVRHCQIICCHGHGGNVIFIFMYQLYHMFFGNKEAVVWAVTPITHAC